MARKVQKIDAGHRQSEIQLARLEQRIRHIYRDAANEMEATVTNYFSSMETRVAKEYELVRQGVMTEQGFRNWCVSTVSRGQRYEAMRDALAERYVQADEVAMAYVNDEMARVYALNRNFEINDLSGQSPYLKGVNFTQYSEATVKRLIVENPSLMPNYPAEKAVRRGFDLAYGKVQITAAVTSGILQGKSLGKVATDMQNRMQTMSRESAMRTARTAVTSAQNAGRQDADQELEEMGAIIEKTWQATDDDRTRESHADADGQTVPVDEPFIVGGEEMMYPADPSGSPENTYNCRCTMISRVTGFVSTLPPELQGSITVED